METPLISVIVPVYNIMDYLPRCVESLCCQTYGNLEILLIDDGSTDGTGKLCDELAVKDNRIRVFHKENGGTSSARNLGLTKAQGTYFAFVDSDDYVEPEMYETLVKGLAQQKCQIIQVGRDEIDENGNQLPGICETPSELVFYPAEDFMKELLMHRGDCSFCTKLVHRDLFRDKAFPVGELNEDFKLLIQMLTQTEGVLALPYTGYHVFYRVGSNTRKKKPDEFSRVFYDNVVNADLAMQLVKAHFPSLDQIALRFGLFQRLDYLLHIPVSQMTRDNEAYGKIASYVKKHRRDALGSPYLTRKNKIYLVLLGTAPRAIRKLHGFTMKLRGIRS